MSLHGGPAGSTGASLPSRTPTPRRSTAPNDAADRFVEVIASHNGRRESDCHTLLNSILLDAGELLRAPRVAIMLHDADAGTLEILDIGTPAFPGRVVKVGEGVAGRVINSGQSLVIDDYEQWPGKISGDVLGPPIVSAVAVPLRSGTVPIGAMTAHSTHPGRRFTTADSHVLEVFADVAMLAVSNYSMQGELRCINSRLESRVRERTEALQRSTEEISRKNEQLEELIISLERAQNDERWRIAQDIHDGVMQTLSGAIFELKAAETSSGARLLAPRLSTARELLRQLEAGLRSVIHNLRPVELEHGGLVRAIEEEARDLQSRYGIRCRVRTLGHQRALPHAVEVAGLMIVKEALRNVQLHSSAVLADVDIDAFNTKLRLRVRDYGDGFEPDLAAGAGCLGLSGMRQRAESAGGTFVLKSIPSHGTEIVASLPLGPLT